MGNTGKNGGLSQALATKIAALPKDTPWVWQLRLSESEFLELEHYLLANRENLITENFALSVLVYLAEWYKRRYSAVNVTDALSLNSAELETIWDKSGLNVDSFVYRDAQGHRRWLYSAYILGGLSLPLELSRGDNGRFLKALCRLYHHEDYTLENLDNEARAISFRESIKREHSLYHYLQAILSGEVPFSQDEVDDSSSLVYQFIQAVKTANEEVLRKKFRFEWIVVNAPGHTSMSRNLRLWLCPEEVNGGLHQYILYDRMHLWGIPSPDKIKAFAVSLRFLNGPETVLQEDFEHPCIDFINTGSPNTGFITLGVTTFAIVRNIPSMRFDRISIMMRTDAGDIYKIQEDEIIPQFFQLWKTEPQSERWSSKPQAQSSTAVIYSKEWESVEGDINPTEKPFKAADGTLSKTWNWTYVNDYVKLRNRQNGKSVTLYNRQGYDRIFTHLYTNCIRYKEGGLVDFVAYDEDGEDMSERLPLVFSREDIRIRHFATKDDILNASPEFDTKPELVEWKAGNGRYDTWFGSVDPPFGPLDLRIIKKGRIHRFRAVFLPSRNLDWPVVRDFSESALLYANYDEGQNISTSTYQDRIIKDGEPLTPTISLKIGPENAHAVVDVWRPTLLKEVLLDGKVASYSDGEPVAMPYILKYEASFRDFTVDGFREYDCRNLGNIYPKLGVINDTHKSFWKAGAEISSRMLDEYSPDNLRICFGKGSLTEGHPVRFFHWDYMTEPVETEYVDITERNTIIFQSLEHIDASLTNIYPVINASPFGWGAVRTKLSIVDCFEVAIRHRLHFFILQPFVYGSPQKFADELYPALLERREGCLTDKDRLGLQRLAEEMDFSWEDYKINI